MSRRLFGALVALMLLAFTIAWTRYQSTEEAAVRAALEHYLQGHATGDGAHFSAVFHPESKLYWVRDQKLMKRTSAETSPARQARRRPMKPSANAGSSTSTSRVARRAPRSSSTTRARD